MNNITIAFFNGKMNDLIDQFGEKAISEPKQRLIYRVIKNLDPLDFTKIIESIIGNSKFAPTLNDFKDLARKYQSTRAVEEKIECSVCNSSGIVNVRKKTGEVGDYAFSCNCKNGLQYGAFPKWHDGLQKTFTRQIVPTELTSKFYNRS